MKKIKNEFKKINNSIIVFFIVLSLILIIFKILGYAPFGNNSVACMDANIQYLDFFSYYKDVLTGKNSILYTFSNTLGESAIAIFSYYLSSPFNILVILFEKTELNYFIDIIFALKIATAGATFAIFLQERFSNKLRKIFIVILSICYAFMQYNIAQSSNIMWLDGVYMLPLILLGVHNLVRKNKIHLLSVSVGLSIIFNWYVAGINCLFSVIWFILEICFKELEENNSIKTKILNFIKSGVKYASSMLLGVMLSAVIFLPTIVLLRNGKGEFDIKMLTNTFNGNVVSVVQNYTLGSVSNQSMVSLFCGSIPIIGCMGYFASKCINKYKKIIMGIFLTVMIMIYYWQPTNLIFTLLKSVSSYWFRYSYISIFSLLFISACFFVNFEELKYNKKLLKNTLIISVLILGLNYVKSSNNLKNIYYTVVFFVISTVLIIAYKKFAMNRKRRTIISMFLLCTVIVEMGYNTKLLLNNYHNKNVEEYRKYVSEQQTQISKLKLYDTGIYRISQTTTRNMNKRNLTANYNEAMAYNYMSNTGYTSCPNNIQLELLQKLGYKAEGSCITITNTSIIGADTLLGVKYVLSPYEINGLKKIEELGKFNNKYIYYNPYYLPMAFLYYSNKSNESILSYNDNCFEYQNEFYSKLVNEKVEIYKKLNYETNEEDGEKIYEIEIPEGNYAVYGNIISNKNMEAKLNINNCYETGYSCWLSPSVFYIPTHENDLSAKVILKAKEFNVKEEQFYALDLNKLQDVVSKLREAEVQNLKIENGKILCSVNAQEGQYLYIPIAYSDGWTAEINGQKIDIELIDNSIITIPLKNGVNEIKLTYKIPYFSISIIITLISLIVLFIIFIYKKLKKE